MPPLSEKSTHLLFLVGHVQTIVTKLLKCGLNKLINGFHCVVNNSLLRRELCFTTPLKTIDYPIHN